MKLITLNKKSKSCALFAQVDDEDFDRLDKIGWCKDFSTGNIYASASINGKKVRMHRYILSITGSKIVVDHEDHDTLNNQKSNLRICSQHENMSNCSRHKDSLSNFRGVSFSKKTKKKWVAQITKNYKHHKIGRFNTEHEAASAYDTKAKELFGKFANLNFKNSYLPVLCDKV